MLNYTDNYVEFIHDGAASNSDHLHVIAKSNSDDKQKLARVVFDFEAANHDELTLAVGQIVKITQAINDDWFEGEIDGELVSYFEGKDKAHNCVLSSASFFIIMM